MMRKKKKTSDSNSRTRAPTSSGSPGPSSSTRSEYAFPEDPQLAMQSFINALKHPDSFKNQMKTGSRDHNVQMTNLSSSVPHQSFATSGISSTTPLIDKTVTDRPIAHSVYQPTTDNRGMQSQIAGNITHTVAQNPTTFGVPNVPTIPMFTPNLAHLSVQQNIAMGFPSSVAGVQGQNLIQRLYLGLLGNLMSNNMRLPGLMMNSGVGLGNNVMNPAQGFVPNTNLGIPGNTAPQTPVMNLTGSTTSPSMNVPDGTGSFKYPAPDTKSLTFDPTIGYRFDPKTGLHYDANSGYFFNSKQKLFLYWDFLSQSYLKVENPTIPFPTLRNEKNVSKVDESSESSGSEDSDEGGRDVSSISRSKSRDRGLLKRQPMTTKQDIPGSSRRYSRSRSRDDDRRSSGSRKRTTNRSRSVDKRKRHRGRSSRSRTPPTRTSESSKNIKRDDSPIAKKSHKRDRRSNSRSPKRRSPRSSNRSKRGDDRRRKRSPDLSRSPSRSSNRKNSRRSRSRDNYRGRLVIRSPLRQNVGHSHKKRSLSPPQEVPSMPPMSKWELEEGTMRYGKASRWQQSPVVSRYSGKRHFSAVEDGGKSSGNNSKRRNQDQNEDLPSDSESVEEMTEELLESLLNGDDGDMNEESEEILPAEKNPCGRVQGDNHPLSDLYKSAPSRIVHLKPSVNGFVWKVVETSLQQHLSTNGIIIQTISAIYRNNYGCPFDYIQITFDSETRAQDWFSKTNRKISLQVDVHETKADFFLYYADGLWGCRVCHLGWNVFFRSLCHNCYNNKSGFPPFIRFSTKPTQYLGFCKLPYSTDNNSVVTCLPKCVQNCHYNSIRVVEDLDMHCCSGLAIIEMASVQEATNFIHRASLPYNVLRYIEVEEEKQKDANLSIYEETPSSYAWMNNRVPGDSDPVSDLYSHTPSCSVHVKPSEGNMIPHVVKKSLEEHLIRNNVNYVLKVSVNNTGMYGSPVDYIQVWCDSESQAESWFLKTKRKITLEHRNGIAADYFLYYAGVFWNCKQCVTLNFFSRSFCHSCYLHKTGNFTAVRFSTSPSTFLGFCDVPFSINKSNFLLHLPLLKETNFNSVMIVDDCNMKGCCGIVIVEMASIEDAEDVLQKATLSSIKVKFIDSKHSLSEMEPHYRLIYKKPPISDTPTSIIGRISKTNTNLPSTSTKDELENVQGSKKVDDPLTEFHELSARAPGDPDPQSDVYTNHPSRIVHAKTHLQGCWGPAIKGSIMKQLVNVQILNFSVHHRNTIGSPFDLVEVECSSVEVSQKWFRDSNRKITLQHNDEMTAEYFLYYADESWNCKRCKKKNFFLRSLCYHCYGERSGEFSPIKVSVKPTRFLGFGKLPSTVNGTNVLGHLPEKIRNFNFNKLHVVRDPKMKLCCGLVIVEAHSVKDAVNIKKWLFNPLIIIPSKTVNFIRIIPQLRATPQQEYSLFFDQNINVESLIRLPSGALKNVPKESTSYIPLTIAQNANKFDVDLESGGNNQESLNHPTETQSFIMKESAESVQNDANPFSSLYDCTPSRLVHLIPSGHSHVRRKAEALLKRHSHEKKIHRWVRLRVLKEDNRLGAPFDFIEVRFLVPKSAEDWFFKTNRKITFDDSTHKTDYYMYYADDPWNCKMCSAENIFFRSLCHKCYCPKKSDHISSIFSEAPTRFIGCSNLPPSTNLQNVMSHLPSILQKCRPKSVQVVEDLGMRCCSGLAIVEMETIEGAKEIVQSTFPFLKYVKQQNIEVENKEHENVLKEILSTENSHDLKVHGDTDSFSDLYKNEPSCIVHVKPSIEGFKWSVVRESLRQHLSVNVTGWKISAIFQNNFGSPFNFILVQFESESIAEEWFLKTNRKIALQHTDEMEADYFLYYADKPWECEFCLEKNIFFRSLCHNCFQDKDYFVNSVRYSITPTQYLGLCKLPPSTSIDNVVSCLPVSGPIVGLKRIRVVEDPNMKCCSGLVILEMSSVEDATKFRQQASLPYRALRYIVDNCGINQEPSLTIEEKFSAAGVKESVNRVQGDLDPFSCFYRSDPSCIVHVKPSMQGFDGSVVKESLQQHLLTNDIKSGKILIVHQNNQGSPFGFIEVRFDSIAQAEKWFLRTNRKITIQHTKAIKAEYFLYYADEPWDCGNCHRARNIFFRVMCYSCSSHKNDPSHSVKFSSEPSKFLGICKMPFSTNEINVMQRLPEIVQDSVLSIRVIDDPGMHVCSGLVVVEVPNVDVAVNIVTSYKSPRVLLRYVDEDVYLGQQKIVSDAAEISEGILDSEKPSSEGNSGDQLVDLVQENTDSYSHLYKSGPSCFVHVKTALERIGIPFHEIKQSLQEYFIQKGMFTQKITPITKDIKGSPFDCIQVLFDSEITAKNWFLETNRKISLQHKLKKMDYFLYYAYQQWYCEFCLKLNFCLRSLCYNCFQHKNNSVKTVRFCTAPTKFLGFCKLPPSTNKGNVVSYLPTVLQNVDLNRIEIVVDTNMECCSGLVIIEMSSVEEAVQVRQQLSLPYRALRYVAESYIGIAENTSPDIEKQVGTAYNPVQNDPDPFSHLYRSDPSRIVHVKAPIKGFKSSMVKKSLQEHLFTNNIKSERILIDQSYNSVGSPFVVIEVRFESIVQVEKWFLLTNRKITLSVDDAMKAEFTLYFADVSWVCGHCPDKKNVFFRATCHHCYRHRSDSSHSFKLSDEPTRFLGVCKMPPSTNDSNVMERLPEAVQDSALCIRVVEDPGMQACGGLVVVELPNVDVAKNIMKSTRRKCSYVDINRQQVMPDGGDTSIDLSLKNHDLSYTLSPKAAPTSSTMEVPIKPSQKAIHSNTSGVIGTQGISYLISKIYTNGPSNIVHVKLTDNELTKATRKATAQLLPQLYELLQQHLQAKEIDFTSIDLRMNELGSPLNFIEVSFKSVDEAKEWFTETSGAVTLSLNEGIEIELQLCYAKNYWYCEFCLAANAFFRSLCHNCYQHKSNDLYSVKFSITPTRHLGFCNIPCWTNSINALTRLPKIMRDSYKIIRVVEDPEMLCCCGLIIVEMPTLEEALTIVEKTGLSYTSLRYVAECDTVSQEFPSRVCMKDPFVGWGYLWHCNHCSKRNVSSRSLCSFCYRHRRDEITPVCFSGVPTKFLGFCQLPRLINESNVLLLLPQNIQRYHFESIRVVDDPTFGGCCGIVIFEMLNVEHAAAYYWLRCPVRYVDMANSDETYHRLLYTRQAPDDLQENMEIGSDEFPISRCVSSAESEENISIVTEKCDIPEVPPSHCSESSLVAGEAQESKESNTLMELVDCTEDPTLPEDVAPAAISCSTEQISSGIDRAETEGNTSIVTKCVVPDDHHCSESPLGIGEALESKESNTLMELVDCNEDPTLPEDVAPAAISCSTEQISSGIDIAETEGNTSIVTKCLVPDDHHCSESPLGSGEALESKDPNTLIELEDFENPTVPEDVAPAAMSCSIEQISSRIDRAETEGNASIVTKCVVPDDHHCSESSPNFDVDQELDESILLVEGGDSKVVATITECVALSESGSNSIQISSEITCAVNEENVSFEKTKIENLIVDTSRYSESSTNEEDQESDKSKMFVKPGDSKIGTNPEIVAAVNIDSNEEMNCTGNQENPSKFIPDVYPSHCSESFSTAEGVEASKQSEIAVEVGDSTISEDVASVGVNCGDVQIFGGNEETKSEIPDVLPSQRSETPPNNMEAQESKESRMIMEDDDCAENLSVSEDVVNIGCSDKDS